MIPSTPNIKLKQLSRTLNIRDFKRQIYFVEFTLKWPKVNIQLLTFAWFYYTYWILYFDYREFVIFNVE